MRIFKIKWFVRFALKNGITDDKLEAAIKEIEEGLIDADLGGGLVKKRISRDGGGKSGGYRSIIALKRGKRAFFLYGFPKNVRDNIDDQELADLKKLAGTYLKLTEKEISKAIDEDILFEVTTNGEKIQK